MCSQEIHIIQTMWKLMWEMLESWHRNSSFGTQLNTYTHRPLCQFHPAGTGYPIIWPVSVHSYTQLPADLVTSDYCRSCCLSIVFDLSAHSALWALTSTRPFPPHNYRSLDIIFFFGGKTLKSLEVVVKSLWDTLNVHPRSFFPTLMLALNFEQQVVFAA